MGGFIPADHRDIDLYVQMEIIVIEIGLPGPVIEDWCMVVS